MTASAWHCATMEEALKLRKAARDSFSRSCKELALTEEGNAFEMSLQDLALEKDTYRLAKFLKRQRRLLDAVTSVIELAADGHQILDSVEVCQKCNLDDLQNDITVETDQLFQSVVRKPSNKLRTFVDKSENADLRSVVRKSSNGLLASADKSKNADLLKFARSFVRRIVAQPIQMFLNAGNTILGAYLKQDDHSEQKQRFRVSILRILMYLSDCFRYRFDHKTAQEVAELMLFSDSKDAEAYMRMAMNAAVTTICTQDLTPFFYYCMFLDNRNVEVNHAEARVVHRYVKIVKETSHSKVSGSDSVRSEAMVKFIDATWALLMADLKHASLKVRNEELWKTLKDFVNEATGTEVLHMIGAFMFSHYRSTAERKDSGMDWQWELADYALSRFVTVLAETVAEKLNEVKNIIRNRKRNRRRSKQKKRKKDATNVHGDGGEVAAFAVLKHIGSLEKQVPHLGALSFMAHYWASRELTIGQHNVHNMAKALQSLKTVVCELRLINELTSTLNLSNYLEPKQFKSSRLLPPLPEDVTFCNFALCERLGMFKNVRIFGATFESLFKSGPPNLQEVIRNKTIATYESFVQATATRHMKAFSLRCAQDAKVGVDDLGFAATLSVVTTAIRKQRISILISKLSKIGGGKIARLQLQVPKVGEAQRSDFEVEASISPPLPGQKPPQECKHLQDEQETTTIDALITKRQRLIGSYTPGHSKGQHATHDDVENDPAAPGSPSLSGGLCDASQKTRLVEKNIMSAELARKEADGRTNRFSKEPSGILCRIRQPVDSETLTTPREHSTVETKSTTLRLLELMYPAHTNSVPDLCCRTAYDLDWRGSSSELPYTNVTKFPALDTRKIQSRLEP